MFQTDDTQVIALAWISICVGDQFGDHEQADTFAAGNAVRQTRKHKMADVFGEIVVSP